MVEWPLRTLCEALLKGFGSSPSVDEGCRSRETEDSANDSRFPMEGMGGIRRDSRIRFPFGVSTRSEMVKLRRSLKSWEDADGVVERPHDQWDRVQASQAKRQSSAGYQE